ncbi:MAG: helix-turn-helix domain-containing protein [Lentisphaerae bacterium]|nr:helix-turn-helix domain-containing protein [Lentisphaerota bacterium]
MKTIYDPRYVRLVQALKAQRRRAGMTQQAVAIALGCCRTRVSKLEQRELRIDVLDYVRLCLIYRTSPSRLLPLLKGEEKPPES